ncbi:MAG: glycosyltransferase family 1 protein [Bacteroidetes bacterium]|nr:glycosyltransferase family 1 protein [Bacteroidota bacterium]
MNGPEQPSVNDFTMEIKHIYWFAYFNEDEPSVRYRAKYPLEQLQKEYNINFSIVYPGYDIHSILNFIFVFFSALFLRRANSVIVFQKIYTRGVYTTALKILLFFRNQNTLYDIDDAEYTRYPDDVMRYFMKGCTACSAGSQSLIDYISEINENVFLLTSPVIDHGREKIMQEAIMTIGWIGYYGAHRDNLIKLFFPAVSRIDFPVKVKLLGVKNEAEEMEIRAYFRDKPNVVIETPKEIDWHNEHSIYDIISTFDVGVAPLLDTEFNRAKSAFKLKQCLSCGVPVLGSRVGENMRFIRDGANGNFCDSEDEYYDRLVGIKQLSTENYRRLSANAKETFDEFSMDHYCDTLLYHFKSKTIPQAKLAL